jgi:hypothetical protein
MNPLCCIAPVSIDRDRTNPVVAKSASQSQLGLDSSLRTLNQSSKQSFSVQASRDLDKFSSIVSQEIEDSKVYSVSGSVSVAGILYKWVNYGKGWRSRWFMLEDGVLSYYKIHGPDKILTSPAGRDKGVRVIGEGSLRYMKKVNWSSSSSSSSSNGGGGNNRLRQCKPFGEIHLKVVSLLYIVEKKKKTPFLFVDFSLLFCCLCEYGSLRNMFIIWLFVSADLFDAIVSCQTLLIVLYVSVDH